MQNASPHHGMCLDFLLKEMTVQVTTLRSLSTPDCPLQTNTFQILFQGTW